MRNSPKTKTQTWGINREFVLEKLYGNSAPPSGKKQLRTPLLFLRGVAVASRLSHST